MRAINIDLSVLAELSRFLKLGGINEYKPKQPALCELRTETVMHVHKNRRRPKRVPVEIRVCTVLPKGKAYPHDSARERARRLERGEA